MPAKCNGDHRANYKRRRVDKYRQRLLRPRRKPVITFLIEPPSRQPPNTPIMIPQTPYAYRRSGILLCRRRASLSNFLSDFKALVNPVLFRLTAVLKRFKNVKIPNYPTPSGLQKSSRRTLNYFVQ